MARASFVHVALAFLHSGTNQMTVLFDTKCRETLGPKSYSETDWEYLDRSGRKEAQRIRTFLDRWVSELPEESQSEMAARLRCGDGTNFESASFEIVVFALLRSLGCTVTLHPNLLNGKSKRPDFLAQTPTGESVYVEAGLASEFTRAQRAAQKQIDRVLDELQRVRSRQGLPGQHRVPPSPTPIVLPRFGAHA